MIKYKIVTDNKQTKHTDSSVLPLVDKLLHARGISTKQEVDIFLNPDYDQHLHSPELLHDMDKACERIEQAITNKEKIAIFGDYDCDGIPGGVILHDFFKSINYNFFENYIPHRHYEGFGLSKTALDVLAERQVKLVITVDCGTSNFEEVEYANKLGVDIIITDHHQPDNKLPAATAVVNPLLGNYPFSGLCGAGVAFKLVQALLNKNRYGLIEGYEKWWLDMVAIATIADMVPLRDENRVLAYYGLKVLQRSRRPGLVNLLKKAGVKQDKVTEEDIGFVIGPRINAASRMDTPETAFRLLTETNVAEAEKILSELETLNTKRKSKVALITKDIHKRLQEKESLPPVLVFGDSSWRPSLVGLTASKLAEEYKRPVFIWGSDGNGVYKGSCRAGNDISVVELMRSVADVFIEFGGHHGAGGFSVKDEHIFEFDKKLNQAFLDLSKKEIKEDSLIIVDSEIMLSDINQYFINQIRKLAPFGEANPKPTFIFKAISPSQVEIFGKNKEHIKLIFSTKDTNIEAIAFFKTTDDFSVCPQIDKICTIIGTVEQSWFRGRQQIRIMIIDILR